MLPFCSRKVKGERGFCGGEVLLFCNLQRIKRLFKASLREGGGTRMRDERSLRARGDCACYKKAVCLCCALSFSRLRASSLSEGACCVATDISSYGRIFCALPLTSKLDALCGANANPCLCAQKEQKGIGVWGAQAVAHWVACSNTKRAPVRKPSLYWSRRRESNPQHRLGKRRFYH